MIGSRIEHYEITAHLGSGGMGEVYQATDSKLGRSVAIKVLPEVFARDVERSARLEREARTLALLNHPHIAAIYGLEVSSAQKYLVMELVPGETLEARISRGPIPLNESLEIAKQIAEALEAAHERGVVHRDLKPANIKITPDGKVKVLDFGLAKALADPSSNPSLSNSPTYAVTHEGMILGTAAYMSPEQAHGKDTDRRTDIFALGCLIYEMLTGRQSFGGESVAHILARIIEREPDWTLLPSSTPPAIRRLLKRCLQKDRNRRLKSADAVRIEIEDVLSGSESLDTPVPVREKQSLPWIVAVVLGVGLVALLIPAVMHLRESVPPASGNANRHRHTIDFRHFVTCSFTGWNEDCVRSVRWRNHPALAQVPRKVQRTTAGRNRERNISLLVAK